MGFSGWLLLAVTLLALYLLGLVGYRLLLNIKALKRELDRAQSLADQVRQFEELAIEPAKPSGEADLSKALLNRRAFERQRAQRHEARQRRLVQRISEIEIDKRYQ